MTDRPFYSLPAAVQLRELHDSGMSYRAIAKTIGYSATTVFYCAQGRDRAGPSLQRDVASMHAQWAKGRATA